MAVLTQDQLKKLRESGLNDNEISSLAQKNGFTLPTTTPSRILSTNEVFSLKKQGLNDTEISTLAQKNNIGLPEVKQDGFLKSAAKDVAKTLLVKPAIRTAQALAAVPVYTFGSDETKQRYQEQIAKDVKVPFTGITVEGQRKFGEGGATQIASDTLKTGSYLYGGQGATKAVGGLVKGNVLRPIATGAFTGGVGGATYGAGEEMVNPEATIGSTLKAGAVGGALGATLGGAIPAVGASIKPSWKVIKDASGKTKMLFASPEDKALYVVNKRTEELGNIVNKSSPLKKLVTSAESQGYNPIKDLSDSDLLVGAVNKDGRIDGKLVQERFNDVMDVPEGIIKKKFEETGEKISLDRVQARMAEVLNSDYVPSKIYKQVQNKYDDIVYGLYQKGKVLTDDGKKLAQDMTYIGDNGERIPYMKSPLINFADLQQEKIDAYKLSNFLDPEKTMGDKAIGRAFKVAIDQDSKSIPELEQINKELGRYLSVKSLIDKLDQKVVKGGRLGKYFAQGIGAIAGQSVGGPLGGIVGAEIGGKVQGQILKGTFGKAVGKDIFEGSLDTLKNQSKNVDALQMPQANTISATKNVISKSIPPNKKSSQAGFISTGGKGKNIKEIYHGTNKIFDEFDVKKTPDGSIWFTDNKKSITSGESGASGSKKIINRFIDENNLKLAGWEEYDKYSLDELQNMGYDGVKLPDNGKVDYQIFYPEKLFKTSISKDLQPLYKEAQKYKSAEEFVKAQGTPVYHGSDVANIIEKEGFKKMPIKTGVNAFGEGSYFTNKINDAKGYGDVVKAFLKKDIKLKKVYDSDAYKIDTKKLINEGYDGTILETGRGSNLVIFDQSNIKTKSQLEQIWKEANSKTSTKQGMTAVNPLTVGAGVSAVGAGAMSIKNKKK